MTDFRVTPEGVLAGYSGGNDTVSIPSTVSKIGYNSFKNMPVKTIVFPSTITEIRDGAFTDCSGLTAVQLNSPLQYVGTNSFDGTLILSAPSDLQIINGNTLHWSPPTNKTASNYKIYVNDNIHTTTTSTSVDLSTLSPGENYTLRVIAVDSVGNDGIPSTTIRYTKSGIVWVPETEITQTATTIATSANGNRLAIGDVATSTVYIYDISSNSAWILRNTITSSQNNFGSSISFSADGETLVVSGDNIVSVYRINKYGEWINFTDISGNAFQETANVVISADSSTIVLGCPQNKGRIYIYKWITTNHLSLIKTIYGTTYSSENLGCSLAVSADGSVLAVGAKYALGNGVVRIYSGAAYGTVSNIYAENGTTEQFGHSVAISSDGKTLIIGAPSSGSTTLLSDSSNNGYGTASVWKNTNGSWVKDCTFYGNTNENFGKHVTINSTGTLISITTNKQKAILYILNNDEWIYLTSFSGVNKKTIVSATGDRIIYGTNAGVISYSYRGVARNIYPSISALLAIKRIKDVTSAQLAASMLINDITIFDSNNIIISPQIITEFCGNLPITDETIKSASLASALIVSNKLSENQNEFKNLLFSETVTRLQITSDTYISIPTDFIQPIIQSTSTYNYSTAYNPQSLYVYFPGSTTITINASNKNVIFCLNTDIDYTFGTNTLNYKRQNQIQQLLLSLPFSSMFLSPTGEAFTTQAISWRRANIYTPGLNPLLSFSNLAIFWTRQINLVSDSNLYFTYILLLWLAADMQSALDSTTRMIGQLILNQYIPYGKGLRKIANFNDGGKDGYLTYIPSNYFTDSSDGTVKLPSKLILTHSARLNRIDLNAFDSHITSLIINDKTFVIQNRNIVLPFGNTRIWSININGPEILLPNAPNLVRAGRWGDRLIISENVEYIPPSYFVNGDFDRVAFSDRKRTGQPLVIGANAFPPQFSLTTYISKNQDNYSTSRPSVRYGTNRFNEEELTLDSGILYRNYKETPLPFAFSINPQIDNIISIPSGVPSLKDITLTAFTNFENNFVIDVDMLSDNVSWKDVELFAGPDYKVDGLYFRNFRFGHLQYQTQYDNGLTYYRAPTYIGPLNPSLIKLPSFRRAAVAIDMPGFFVKDVYYASRPEKGPDLPELSLPSFVKSYPNALLSIPATPNDAFTKYVFRASDLANNQSFNYGNIQWKNNTSLTVQNLFAAPETDGVVYLLPSCHTLYSYLFGTVSSQISSIKSYAPIETDIPPFTFKNCHNLKQTNFILKNIGESAFEGCTSLESCIINCGQQPNNIGNNAFKECKNIKSLSFNGDDIVIREGVFADCNKSLQTIDLSGSKSYQINSNVFKNFSTLKTIRINGTIPLTIGESAFEGCSSIETISPINMGVSSENIGINAFKGCNALQELTLYGNDVILKTSVFNGCSGLKSVSLNGTIANKINTNFFKDNLNLTTIQITGTAPTTIGAGACQNCINLTTLQLPDANPVVIGESAFEGCVGLRTLPPINMGSNPNNLGPNSFKNCSNIQALNLIGTNVIVKDSVFNGCTGIKNIVLSGSESNTIEGLLFNSSPTIRDLLITNSGQVIVGEQTFSNCNNLSTIRFAGRNRQIAIGAAAFKSCSGLASVQLSEGGGTIVLGTDAFANCTSLLQHPIFKSSAFSTELSLAVYFNDTAFFTNNMPTITVGKTAFKDCTGLNNTVELEGKIITVDENAYEGCTNIKRLDMMGNTSNNIGKYAFKGCSNLTSLLYYVRGKQDVGSITIGESAFEELPALSYVNLNSKNPILINKTAFKNCSNITELYIRAFTAGSTTSPVVIGESAFENVNKITTLTINGAVQSAKDPYSVTIDASAFKNCTSLKTIRLRGSNVQLGTNAFSGCSALTDLYIEGDSVSLGENVFAGCTSLKNVTIINLVTNCLFDTSVTQKLETLTVRVAESVAMGTITGINTLKSIEITGSYDVSVTANFLQNCPLLETVNISSRLTPLAPAAAFNDTLTSCPAIKTVLLTFSTDTECIMNPLINRASLLIFDISGGSRLTLPESFCNGNTALTRIGIQCRTLTAQSTGNQFSGCNVLQRMYMNADVSSSNMLTINTIFPNLTDLEIHGFINVNALPEQSGTHFWANNVLTNLTIKGTLYGTYGNIPKSVIRECRINYNEPTDLLAYSFMNAPELVIAEFSPINDIQIGAFYGCKKLVTFDFSKLNGDIGDWAFANSALVGEIVIPSTATPVGTGYFVGCKNITKITYNCNVMQFRDPTRFTSDIWNELIYKDVSAGIYDVSGTAKIIKGTGLVTGPFAYTPDGGSIITIDDSVLKEVINVDRFNERYDKINTIVKLLSTNYVHFRDLLFPPESSDPTTMKSLKIPGTFDAATSLQEYMKLIYAFKTLGQRCGIERDKISNLETLVGGGWDSASKRFVGLDASMQAILTPEQYQDIYEMVTYYGKLFYKDEYNEPKLGDLFQQVLTANENLFADGVLGTNGSLVSRPYVIPSTKFKLNLEQGLVETIVGDNTINVIDETGDIYMEWTNPIMNFVDYSDIVITGVVRRYITDTVSPNLKTILRWIASEIEILTDVNNIQISFNNNFTGIEFLSHKDSTVIDIKCGLLIVNQYAMTNFTNCLVNVACSNCAIDNYAFSEWTYNSTLRLRSLHAPFVGINVFQGSDSIKVDSNQYLINTPKITVHEFGNSTLNDVPTLIEAATGVHPNNTRGVEIGTYVPTSSTYFNNAYAYIKFQELPTLQVHIVLQKPEDWFWAWYNSEHDDSRDGGKIVYVDPSATVVEVALDAYNTKWYTIPEISGVKNSFAPTQFTFGGYKFTRNVAYTDINQPGTKIHPIKTQNSGIVNAAYNHTTVGRTGKILISVLISIAFMILVGLLTAATGGIITAFVAPVVGNFISIIIIIIIQIGITFATKPLENLVEVEAGIGEPESGSFAIPGGDGSAKLGFFIEVALAAIPGGGGKAAGKAANAQKLAKVAAADRSTLKFIKRSKIVSDIDNVIPITATALKPLEINIASVLVETAQKSVAVIPAVRNTVVRKTVTKGDNIISTIGSKISCGKVKVPDGGQLPSKLVVTPQKIGGLGPVNDSTLSRAVLFMDDVIPPKPFNKIEDLGLQIIPSPKPKPNIPPPVPKVTQPKPYVPKPPAKPPVINPNPIEVPAPIIWPTLNNTNILRKFDIPANLKNAKNNLKASINPSKVSFWRDKFNEQADLFCTANNLIFEDIAARNKFLDNLFEDYDRLAAKAAQVGKRAVIGTRDVSGNNDDLVVDYYNFLLSVFADYAETVEDYSSAAYGFDLGVSAQQSSVFSKPTRPISLQQIAAYNGKQILPTLGYLESRRSDTDPQLYGEYTTYTSQYLKSYMSESHVLTPPYLYPMHYEKGEGPNVDGSDKRPTFWIANFQKAGINYNHDPIDRDITGFPSQPYTQASPLLLIDSYMWGQTYASNTEYSLSSPPLNDLYGNDRTLSSTIITVKPRLNTELYLGHRAVNYTVTKEEAPNLVYSGVRGLTIIIPETAGNIPDYAFNSTDGKDGDLPFTLTTVYIDSSITSIGKQAFYRSSLKYIYIPPAATIGNNAFGYTSLQAILSNPPIADHFIYHHIKQVNVQINANTLCTKTTGPFGDAPNDARISLIAYQNNPSLRKEHMNSTLKLEIADSAMIIRNNSVEIPVDVSNNWISVTTPVNNEFIIKTGNIVLKDGRTIYTTAPIHENYTILSNSFVLETMDTSGQWLIGAASISFKDYYGRRFTASVADISSCPLTINITGAGYVQTGRRGYQTPVLRDIIVPTETKIKSRAFVGNNALTNVTFPTNCISIGIEAFKGCTTLSKTIYLPPTIKYIKDRAFEDTNIAGIIIPPSVEDIGEAIIPPTTSVILQVDENNQISPAAIILFDYLTPENKIYIPSIDVMEQIPSFIPASQIIIDNCPLPPVGVQCYKDAMDHVAGGLTVAWENISGPQSSPVHSNDIICVDTNTGETVEFKNVSSPFIIQNTLPDIEYLVTVIGINAIGESSAPPVFGFYSNEI